MTIILSCGHSCNVRENGIGIHEKIHARDGAPAVSYSHICHPCYVEAVKDRPDTVLFDDVEIDDFMKEAKA